MVPVAAQFEQGLLHLEGSFNARGIGPGAWLIRSASLDALTAAGAESLTGLGVTLVIDLREDSEVPESASHQFPVRRVPLYQLPDGPPQAGSLEQVYDLLINSRGAELASAVRAIADASGPVLVHCTAGKDRTGLVVALALEAAGIPRRDIVTNYELSAAEVRVHRSEAVHAILERLELNSADHAASLRLHLESPAEAIEHALYRIDELGGPVSYLTEHGLTESQLERLRARVQS